MKNINDKLDSYIFETLNVKFSPDYSKATSNLENSEEDNENYLATYFPRSFFESYKIFNNIFSNQLIYNKFDEKENIVIVDILPFYRCRRMVNLLYTTYTVVG